MAKQPIPFSFVLDELFDQHIRIKPMFGCHALYKGEELVLVLRKRDDHIEDNGVWVATRSPESRSSLKKQFSSLCTLKIFGAPESAWQNIPEDCQTFESDVLEICALIRKGDPRIGKVPDKKRKPATDKPSRKKSSASGAKTVTTKSAKSIKTGKRSSVKRARKS
jgi:hypothetical protein